MIIKRAIVVGLDWFDDILDWLPGWDGGWRRHALLGCRLGLANRADQLDQRWATGVWGWPTRDELEEDVSE